MKKSLWKSLQPLVPIRLEVPNQSCMYLLEGSAYEVCHFRHHVRFPLSQKKENRSWPIRFLLQVERFPANSHQNSMGSVLCIAFRRGLHKGFHPDQVKQELERTPIFPTDYGSSSYPLPLLGKARRRRRGFNEKVIHSAQFTIRVKEQM